MMQLFYLLPAFVILAVTTFGEGAESEPIQECLKESDPMGATYRGTAWKTENGLECQRWDTDEPHRRHQKPDDPDNNYCRNPNPDEEVSRLPWCYTNVPGDPRWEYCSIKTCRSCSGVMYDDKCYLVVYWNDYPNRLDHDEAVKYCKRHGGYLANFYSRSHMEAVMKYIREQEYFNGFAFFDTGMNFDPLENKFTLRNGTDAPGDLKWWPGNRHTGTAYSDYTNVLLWVGRHASSTNQYLWNRRPSFKSNVLCEIE